MPTHRVHPSRPRVLVLGDENPSRHRPGVNDEDAPRPKGMASGLPWKPRTPVRNFTMHELTDDFLETIERFPWLQPAAAAAFHVLATLKGTAHEPPPPPDVADPAAAWTFDAVGDYGSGSPHEAAVARNVAASDPDLVITVGDNVYPTGRWQDYERHFVPFYGALAHKVPFMPSLGNHDMYHDDLRAYFGHFPQLHNLPYYTFTFRNAQFFALDGDEDLTVGSPQYEWLQRELAASSAHWKVVYLHYPMYGRTQEFDDIRDAVQPLLAAYGVQLAVEGHEHNYQRAVPVDGVLHVLTGGGGQQVYDFLGNAPAWTARRGAIFHHLQISVGDDEMVVRAIAEDGTRYDTAVIPWHGPIQTARQGAATLRHRRRADRRPGARRRHAVT